MRSNYLLSESSLYSAVEVALFLPNSDLLTFYSAVELFKRGTIGKCEISTTIFCLLTLFFLLLFSGGWGKTNLKLATLPRILVHASCANFTQPHSQIQRYQ